MNPRRSAAFSLVEMLVTIAIVTCLAGLATPTVNKLTDRTHRLNCVNNLRQIGLAAQLYSTDHDQRLPLIESWPSQPIYASDDGAQPILTVLGPYGLTERSLTCHKDITGPNYLAREGSSYEWCPMANGQRLQNITLPLGGATASVPLERLIVAFDYSSVHNGTSNILFGDGHVAGGND